MIDKFLNFIKFIILPKEKVYWFKGFGYDSMYDNELIFLQTIAVTAKSVSEGQYKAVNELKTYHPKIVHIFAIHYEVGNYTEFFKKSMENEQ